MFKNKFKIKEINLRELLFPITKVAVILISIIVFLFALKFVYRLFNDIYTVTPSGNTQPFFNLEELKAVGLKWGINVESINTY